MNVGSLPTFFSICLCSRDNPQCTKAWKPNSPNKQWGRIWSPTSCNTHENLVVLSIWLADIAAFFCWGVQLYFNINSVVMHVLLCAVLKGKKNRGRQPVTWASVGTSFPLAFGFFPTPDGREQFVFCTTGRRALLSSAPAERHGRLLCKQGQPEIGVGFVHCGTWVLV